MLQCGDGVLRASCFCNELPATMNSARLSSAQLLLAWIGKLGWCAHSEGSARHPAACHLMDVDWPVKVESARLSSAQHQWWCWPRLGSWGGVRTRRGVHGILQPANRWMWIGHWKWSRPEELEFLQGVCFSQQHSVPDFGSGDDAHTRRGVPVILADHRVCVSWHVANLHWSTTTTLHIHCAQEGNVGKTRLLIPSSLATPFHKLFTACMDLEGWLVTVQCLVISDANAILKVSHSVPKWIVGET